MDELTPFEELKDYFFDFMIDANSFSDDELSIILNKCSELGFECSSKPEDFRHFQYHCLSLNLSGTKLVKVAATKEDREMVSRTRFIKDMGKYFDGLLTINENTIDITVYCSGSPNYFIYGVNYDTNESYVFLDNQHWVKTTNKLSNSEIDKMTMVESSVDIQVP